MQSRFHGILARLERLSQHPRAGRALTAAAAAFFVLFVLFPLFFIFTRLGSFRYEPAMGSALATSFAIAACATAIDLLFGVPIAWLLAKKRFPLRGLFDAIIDLPLVIPTSALGLSLALFWGTQGTALLEPGFALLVLLHVAITISYVVRTTQAAIAGIDDDLGRASQSLGASPMLSFRTIWLPLFSAGTFSGAVLAFTRSLGETGATLLAAGAVQTVPVLTVFYKNAAPPDMDAAISLSMVLVAVSAALFLLVRRSASPGRFFIGRIFVEAEKRLSAYSMKACAVALGAFLLAVLVPSLFFLRFTDFDFFASATLNAIGLSFAIGIAATLVTFAFGLPFSLYLSSGKRGSGLFTLANDMALLVPTVTIGVSLSLFWGGLLPEPALLVLTSVAVIFPYFASSVSNIAAGMDRELVEVARSLGARPLYAFRTVTLPILMPALVAGTLIAFMRSVAETGSTLAISKTAVTIPILVVNLAMGGQYAAAASAAVPLLALAVAIVVVLRHFQNGKR